MPRHLGRKWKRVADAHERHRAALEAAQLGLGVHALGSKSMRAIHQELQAAIEEKDAAREHPESEYDCSWCHKLFDGAEERLVIEVTLATHHKTTTRMVGAPGQEVEVTEPVELWEYRNRQRPVYLVACGRCIVKHKLKEDLTE